MTMEAQKAPSRPKCRRFASSLPGFVFLLRERFLSFFLPSFRLSVFFFTDARRTIFSSYVSDLHHCSVHAMRSLFSLYKNRRGRALRRFRVCNKA
jgi:hypothetical protein